MKSYNQFVGEAYSARENLDEGVGKLLSKAGSRFIPFAQTAYGLYSGTSKLMKGDTTGAVLGYGSALPGPLGWGFVAADIARDLAGPGNAKKEKEKEKEKDETKDTPSKSTTVLAKKGGEEGVLDKSTGEWTAKKWQDAGRERYKEKRGAEQIKKDAETVAKNRTQNIDATIKDIEKKSNEIKNPFKPQAPTPQPTQTPVTPAPTAQPTQTPVTPAPTAQPTQQPVRPQPQIKKKRFDIRDRDIRARASFDPRYDRR